MLRAHTLPLVTSSTFKNATPPGTLASVFEVGQVVGGDFRIVRPLSEGGMGQVFVAEQLSTGAKRALKAIHRELVNQPTLRQRFEQEARVAARIPSEHIVQVVAAGIDAPTQAPWLAMELLSGQTLDAAVNSSGPFDPERVVEVLNQLCHALSAAHGAGVVHRDIKPENVFLAETRRTSGPAFFVKVLDFGIARVRAEAQTQRTGAVGTPLWMAPEQTSTSTEIGPWTDIWPLGLVAFWMLTGGRYYWRSVNAPDPTMSMLREILFDPLPPASVRASEIGASWRFGPAFDAWFARCVSRETGSRFPSADVACAELARALQPTKSAAPALANTEPAPSPLAMTPIASSPPAAPMGTHPLPQRPAPAAMPAAHPNGIVSSSARRAFIIVAIIFSVVVVLLGIASFGGTYLLLKTSPARSAADPIDQKCSSEKERYSPLAEDCRKLCVQKPKSPSCVHTAMIDISWHEPESFRSGTEILSKSCDAGNNEACERYALLTAFPNIEAVAPDTKKAMALARKTCESEPKACGLVAVGMELSWDEVRKDNIAVLYAKACRAGSPFGCAYQAAYDLRTNERADEASRSKALVALEPACRDGDVTACGVAGTLLEAGGDRRAAELYEKACTGGDLLGCNNVTSLLAGNSAKQAPVPPGLSAFTYACERGEPAACNNAGILKSGLLVDRRVGPRGATVYRPRCQRGFEVGCAGGGQSLSLSQGSPVDLVGAARLFQKGCEGGLQPSCVTLGALTMLGRGVAKDRSRARTLFQRACERGDAGGCGQAAMLELLPLRERAPDHVKALDLAETACGGDIDFCWMAYSLRFTSGVAANSAEQARLVLASLEKGCETEPLACSFLGHLYYEGREYLPKDQGKARNYFQRSCEKSLPAVGDCVDHAMEMMEGEGGPKDVDRGFELLKKSCDDGNRRSCHRLGTIYAEGRKADPLVKKNISLAARVCDKACGLGEVSSCDALARALIGGVGVPKDAARGSAIAMEACDDGSPMACATYGLALADGAGVTKNEATAKEYLTSACEYHVDVACQRLKKMGARLPTTHGE